MSELDRSALKARNNLLALFLVYVILDTILVVIAKDIWAIGRILVTIVVMYFTLQGRKWAKWALIGILSFLIVALLALVVALYSKLSTMGALKNSCCHPNCDRQNLLIKSYDVGVD